MKAIAGMGLLILVLLALTLVGVNYVQRSADWLGADLPQVELAIAGEDWETARESYQECADKWERVEKVWRAMINHEDMRDIDVAMVHLEVALKDENRVEAEKELAGLIYFIQHVPETERVEWGNIL